jgi:hypothetical protein
MSIYVLGSSSEYNYPEDEDKIINTTSRSNTWSRGLSPFVLGPVKLYGEYTAKNVENGWQYSKVYMQHTNYKLDPSPAYFKWAKAGWDKQYADRYPMGHGVKPLYSYWDGEKLTYVEARKRIYIPLYSTAARNTDAFKKLKQIYESEKDIWLWDFDAYNLTPGTFKYQDLIDNENSKLGHAYVLAMMLEGII